MSLKLGLILAFALLAGIFGGRPARRQRRSFYDEKPIGMSDAEFKRQGDRRALRRRLLSGLLYGCIGALLGWIAALTLRLS
jgi:hypothetical protein